MELSWNTVFLFLSIAMFHTVHSNKRMIKRLKLCLSFEDIQTKIVHAYAPRDSVGPPPPLPGQFGEWWQTFFSQLKSKIPTLSDNDVIKGEQAKPKCTIPFVLAG